nr:RNA-directed DNA polymerase, eukaryota, reverse transcriptase zinc-binding domain protein [Tanacetum cinerariifolium]
RYLITCKRDNHIGTDVESSKGGSGGGSKSLYEPLKEFYDDDDDNYEDCDLTKDQMVFCDVWDVNLRGQIRKVFSVKSMRNHIIIMSNHIDSHPTRLNQVATIKVNILTWRVMNKRIPTRTNLDRREIDLDSFHCPLCDEDLESEDRIFVSCKIGI